MSPAPVEADWQARIAALEAEREVRNLIARYMELCDTLDASTPMDELGGLFARDAIWLGKGDRYGTAFGEHHGRAAILAMLESYRQPNPHFALNAHFLCSEAIDVAGDTANGSWMMLQTSTYSDGRSDLRGARLRVTFTPEEGRWRIARFESENIFCRPVDRWDDPAPIAVPTRQGG